LDAASLAVACLLWAPRPGQEPATAAGPLFVEEPVPGLVTTSGSTAKDYIIEVNGPGLVLQDFDGDGDVDLVVIDGSTLERAEAGEPGLPPRLYLNDGDGRFAPAPEAWAMDGGRWGTGGAAGDLDGDGWPDLVVLQWGPDRVFLNRGGQGFEEITERAGLQGERWGTSAALFDYDGDGVLDLAVINYLAFDRERVGPPGGRCTWKGHPVMCGPEGLTPVHDQLYRGIGDGTFREVTAEAGFRPAEAGFGLGVTALDHDLDGRVDLYVSNDSTPNFLWENQGDGTFEEVGFLRAVSHDGSGKEQAGMGIAAADVDGDGRQDLLVTNFSGESNALYQTRGGKGFRERSSASGLGGPSIVTLGWGASLEDFDLDGDVDAAVLNGHVYPQADLPGTDTSYAQPDHFYENTGGGHFTLRPLSNGPDRVSRASAVADLDRDGDLDLVAVELDGGVYVLRNRTRTRDGEGGPHWLTVRPHGKGSNSFALGATVRAEWEGGARTAEIRTSGGYQSSVPPEAHFGLGGAGAARVIVRWPSGREQVLEDVPADRTLDVEEPLE